MSGEWKNKLYFGDNLAILKDHVEDESVDLIYLDPPFNSQATYNVLFAEKSGEKSEAQITAFEDTWRWGIEAEATYRELVTVSHGRLGALIQAFRSFLGTNDMMAYLIMMAARLAELHRVLKNTGSLYLHCDPTASHYIKLLLDATFGTGGYRSEIIWKRSSAHSDTKQGRQQYGRIHDVIFFYTKSRTWTWHPSYTPYDTEYVEQFYKYVEPETGRLYRLGDLTGPGGAAKGNPKYEVMGVTRYWRYSRKRMNELIKEGRIVQTSPGAVPSYKRYLDEMTGVSLADLWMDMNPIAAQSAERLGYPTQKPEPLLERIINASSNEGDIILDPFCGCGTTIAVAERLHRRWIGVDITHLSISLMRHRLHDVFGAESSPHSELAPYEVIGQPKDLESARALAQEVNRYDFQFWAVSLVEAFPAQGKKKGADRGVDGFINFFDDDSGKAKKLLIQVKSGHVSSRDIRDLVGVLERENAHIGAFITLEEPSDPMRVEALSAGFYDPEHYKEQRFPRVQILTIADLLAGKRIQYPTGMGNTFKRAKRRQKRNLTQTDLF